MIRFLVLYFSLLYYINITNSDSITNVDVFRVLFKNQQPSANDLFVLHTWHITGTFIGMILFVQLCI